MFYDDDDDGDDDGDDDDGDDCARRWWLGCVIDAATNRRCRSTNRMPVGHLLCVPLREPLSNCGCVFV